MHAHGALNFEAVARTLLSIWSRKTKRITLCFQSSEIAAWRPEHRPDLCNDAGRIDRALSSFQFRHLNYALSNAPFEQYFPFLLARGIAQRQVPPGALPDAGLDLHRSQTHLSGAGSSSSERCGDTVPCWHCSLVSSSRCIVLS